MKWHGTVHSFHLRRMPEMMYQLQTKIANKVLKQSTQNLPAGTAPGSQLSGEVSYIFVSLSVGLPTLTNWKPATEI